MYLSFHDLFRISGNAASDKNIKDGVCAQIEKNFAKAKWKVKNSFGYVCIVFLIVPLVKFKIHILPIIQCSFFFPVQTESSPCDHSNEEAPSSRSE